MIYIVLALAICVVMAWLAYTHVPPAPAQISQTVTAYDNQYELFRDMEPADQTRENSWVGFLQENVRKNRTGPIGDFLGNDSSSGNASLYQISALPEPTMIEPTNQDPNTPRSKATLYDVVTGAETDVGPGTFPLAPSVTKVKIYPPLVVVIENTAGIKQTTKYLEGTSTSIMTIDKSYNFNKITLSKP